MEPSQTFLSSKHRIETDIRHFKGSMPDRFAIAWYGYIGALVEWGSMTIHEHGELCGMLPDIEDNPIVEILVGRTEP